MKSLLFLLAFWLGKPALGQESYHNYFAMPGGQQEINRTVRFQVRDSALVLLPAHHLPILLERTLVVSRLPSSLLYASRDPERGTLLFVQLVWEDGVLALVGIGDGETILILEVARPGAL